MAAQDILYDGNGRRFRTNDGNVVNYVYSYTGQLLMEDRITESASNNYIYFNGQVAAIHQQDDNLRLLFKDHLGSTRRVVTVSLSTNGWQYYWNLTESYGYEPFGASGSSGLTRQMFQGKERNGDLDYYGARYYDSRSTAYGSMRWISADSVTSRIYDPPSLNKYTYVRNDPVNWIDPDGRLQAPVFNWVEEESIWWTWFLNFDLPWSPSDGGGEGGGGGPPTNQIRNDFLHQVLGDNSKNVATRIGDQSSPCWKYLQGLIDKLGISSLSSPKDLVQHLNDATYDVMGDVNGTVTDGPANFGPNGSIWAEATSTNPIWSPINKVTLGWKFFNSTQMNPSSVLIHEAFHLFSGTNFGLFFTTGLDDKTLFAKAGVDSGEAFNKKIDDNCK